MSGFVYIWYDKETKRYYIGSHWGSENDGYICSSDSMREAYRRRSTDFRRKILAKITTNHLELLVTEQRWLDMIKPYEFGRKYYNINSNVHKWIWWMNEETKKLVGRKISKSQKGKHKTNKGTFKKGHKYGMTGKHHSEETKKKIGQANQIALQGNIPWNKGIGWSEEVKEKNRQFHLGKKPSEETKRKMSLSQMKRRYNETKETIQKLREANLGERNPMYGKAPWMKGKHHTNETKEKMSLSHKGHFHSEET